MTDTLPLAFPLDVMIVRMLATAAVVMGITWAVGRFGPIIGGALAGLPIVLGPGFYFMVQQAPAPFVAQAAAYTLLSLCATQCFLIAYIACAARLRPWATLGCAVLCWLLAVLLFRPLPPWLLLGALLFTLVTVSGRIIGRRFLRTIERGPGPSGWPLLLARGILAGLLVAGVTTASGWLGARDAGLLMAFPIGYSVIAVTIQQNYGAAHVVATLHAALLGTLSLAGFSLALAHALAHWPPLVALGAALATAFLITLGLVLRPRLSR